MYANKHFIVITILILISMQELCKLHTMSLSVYVLSLLLPVLNRPACNSVYCSVLLVFTNMSVPNLKWKWELEDVCRKQDRYCLWSANSFRRFWGDI